MLDKSTVNCCSDATFSGCDNAFRAADIRKLASILPVRTDIWIYCSDRSCCQVLSDWIMQTSLQRVIPIEVHDGCRRAIHAEDFQRAHTGCLVGVPIIIYLSTYLSHLRCRLIVLTSSTDDRVPTMLHRTGCWQRWVVTGWAQAYQNERSLRDNSRKSIRPNMATSFVQRLQTKVPCS